MSRSVVELCSTTVGPYSWEDKLAATCAVGGAAENLGKHEANASCGWAVTQRFDYELTDAIFVSH